jgi:hypothetical protein
MGGMMPWSRIRSPVVRAGRSGLRLGLMIQ